MSDLPESVLDRAMEIGNEFVAWTDDTGPCPISVVDTSTVWGKRLCALFEKQALLEARAEKAEAYIKRLEAPIPENNLALARANLRALAAEKKVKELEEALTRIVTNGDEDYKQFYSRVYRLVDSLGFVIHSPAEGEKE